MRKQDYERNNLKIKVVTRALAAASSQEEQQALNEIITDLKTRNAQATGYLSKAQVAKSLNIDRRTLTSDLWKTGAIGIITDSPQAMKAWKTMKMLSPLQVEIVYQHLGYPPLKTTLHD